MTQKENEANLLAIPPLHPPVQQAKQKKQNIKNLEKKKFSHRVNQNH